MHIVGTAGHVDHGKSSLVIALTGHNPDRLIEEQQRGMTLDLGFAPLRFPDGVEAGIIDVPGHERFLHNMLAGAAGMELLLLVIAAPEGPKQQTFEHLHILNFLNVSRAIIVLTKIDLVDPDGRKIAHELARDAARGTVAADAPIIEVSTVTGEGIDSLKAAIHEALAALPARRPQAPAYLPVDRVFALPGHGTIVTGTLMQGIISIGDTLALQPSGHRVRVKNLQVFGRRVESATGGSRVAVNVPSVDVSDVARGEALVATREFQPARELLVDFTALPSATQLLRRRTPVRVHIGSAEIPGQLRFADGPPHDGAKTQARVVLWKPTVFYPGLRIIVRRMSPKDLLGGAVVRGAASNGATSAQPAVESAAALDLDDAPRSAVEILEAVSAAGLAPLPAAKIAAQANVTLPVAEAALSWLIASGRVAQLRKPVEFVSQAALDSAFIGLESFMRERHAKSPWRLGVSTQEAAKAFNVPEALALRLLGGLEEDGRVAIRAGAWHAPDFSPSLTKAQTTFFETAVAVLGDAPYLPHSYEALARNAAQSRDLSEALESLLAVGAFVRVGDDLYRRSQIEGAQSAIAAHMGADGRATMAQLRDVLGTSRKYALPLMEYFDSIGFTMRDGDMRRLRKARQS
jgi:selenocysteine-specific elongation factor